MKASKHKTGLAALALALLSAPAWAHKPLVVQPPPPASCAVARPMQLGPIAPVKQESFPKAVQLGNDSTFYVQMGGGSIVPFFLLGPLGTAISAESIKHKTEAQAAAADKSSVIDPREVLTDVLAQRPLAAGEGAAASPAATPIVVTPFVVYLRPKKSQAVERRLVLDIACDGWEGWYTDHLSAIPSERLNETASAGELAAFNADLHGAAGKLLDLFVADAKTPPTDMKAMEVQSWQLNPYFKAALPQDIREVVNGQQVIVGQGLPNKNQWIMIFMKGVHLMDPARITIGKAW